MNRNSIKTESFSYKIIFLKNQGDAHAQHPTSTHSFCVVP